MVITYFFEQPYKRFTVAEDIFILGSGAKAHYECLSSPFDCDFETFLFTYLLNTLRWTCRFSVNSCSYLLDRRKADVDEMLPAEDEITRQLVDSGVVFDDTVNVRIHTTTDHVTQA